MKDHKGPFNIEIYEIIYWESIMVFTNYLTACRYASEYINENYWPEHKIRILDYYGKIL